MGRVVVFGSINQDVVVQVDHHAHPGETILGQSIEYFPGGKGANQAVAAAKMGAKTFMVAKVGNDPSGEVLKQILLNEGGDTFCIDNAETPTGTAYIIIDKTGENSIVVVPGANTETRCDQFENLDLNEEDVIVCQNEVPVQEIKKVFTKARQQGCTTIYNPAPAIAVPAELLVIPDYLIVNETEYEIYKDQVKDDEQTIIQTLGANGLICRFKNQSIEIKGHAVKAVDTTGAGDCFAGSLAAGLAQNMELSRALEMANKAASLCVQKSGAASSMPKYEDLNL